MGRTTQAFSGKFMERNRKFIERRDRKMKRLSVLFGVLVISVALLGGLSYSEEYTFYFVSHGGPGDPYWAVVMNGMNDAADMLTKGTDDVIRAIYFGPAVYSLSEFVDMLQSAIAANPDGIAVTVPDPAAIETPLRRAIEEKGIPVIAIDVPDFRPRDERIPYLLYIGNDEYLSGRLCGERMLSIRPSLQRAVVLIHEVGHIGLEMRAQGFLDAMSEAGVPAEKLFTGIDPTQAIEILKGYFSAHPDTEGILTLGPIDAAYTIQFLKEQGLTGSILMGAFDLSEDIVEGIRQGIVAFTNVAQQYLLGYYPVVFLYLYNKYGLIPVTDIATGPRFIDSSNIEEVVEMVKQGYW